MTYRRSFSLRVKDDSVKLIIPVVRNYFYLALLYLISYFWFTKSFRFITSTLTEFSISEGVVIGFWGIFSLAILIPLVGAFGVPKLLL